MKRRSHEEEHFSNYWLLFAILIILVISPVWLSRLRNIGATSINYPKEVLEELEVDTNIVEPSTTTATTTKPKIVTTKPPVTSKPKQVKSTTEKTSIVPKTVIVKSTADHDVKIDSETMGQGEVIGE